MGAAYNSQERSPPPRCLPGTRKEVLAQIDTWVKAGARGKPVLWLHGPAGAGKSAIAQTIAETCAARNQLVASFFFARTVAHRNEVKHLFPTIAVQIALSAPAKRQRLDEIINTDPYIAERALGSVDLLTSLLDDRPAHAPLASSPLLVIIDGLDESQRNDNQCWILAQVSRVVFAHHLPLRFLIVSRPESHLEEAFEERDLANITKIVSLYGDYRASRDVSMYLRSEFSRIYGAKRHRAVMRFIAQPWPSEDTIKQFVRKSGGYFIYASTIVKFIDEEYFSPVSRLDQVLGRSNSSLLLSESNPFAELDQLYIQILSSCPTSHLPMLKLILGYAVMSPVFATRGTSLPPGKDILDLAPGQMELTLRGLRSLVSFTYSQPSLIHASFGDFLLDRARALHYHIDSDEWIYTTFRYAFSLECKSLNPDNCSSPPLEGQLLYLPSDLPPFLQSSFKLSSRKDQLVGLVRESLEQSLWSSCFSQLDSWSDEEKFRALGVLGAIIHPENQVSVAFFQLVTAKAVALQYETFSPANQGFIMQLRTRCDSVLHTYLSKIADSVGGKKLSACFVYRRSP